MAKHIFDFDEKKIFVPDGFRANIPAGSRLAEFLTEHPDARVMTRVDGSFEVMLTLQYRRYSYPYTAIFDSNGAFIRETPVPKNVGFKSAQHEIGTKGKVARSRIKSI